MMPETLPKNKKIRLEKKLRLAKESGEPVFDLSDCSLTSVPKNIYSLCRELRKAALYLQENQLTNLSGGGELFNLRNLEILDINTNNFSKLPVNIFALQNLQVLNVSKNQLTELPEAIGKLQHLKVLNVSQNKLTCLPDSIGNCQRMETLNVSGNKPLKELPKTLGKLMNLVEFNFDSTITYPPPEVCKAGVADTLKFLRKELKGSPIPSTSTKYEKQVHMDSSLEEQLRLQEEYKLNAQKKRLEFEKSLAKRKEDEIKLQEQAKQQKSKILQDIKSQEKSLNAELSKLQVKKNEERAALIKHCQEEEKKSSEIVNKILNLKKSQRISLLWEIERKEEEAYLLSHAKSPRSLEAAELFDVMETLIKEDLRKAQIALTEKRNRALNSLTAEIVTQQEELYNFMKKRNVSSAQLLEEIRKNEDLQKVAVTSLLEKSDAASWELTKQISIVESQLAKLTRIELKKRKLQANSQISSCDKPSPQMSVHVLTASLSDTNNAACLVSPLWSLTLPAYHEPLLDLHAVQNFQAQLNQNRLALTDLLQDLLKKKGERRKVLVEMIIKMEKLKESCTNSSSFWMEQYNKLFDSKAYQMVKFLESVDQKLVFELFVNEVFQYLPLLKDIALNEKALENLDLNTLSKLGVEDTNDRTKILQAVESYLRYKNFVNVEPSAPLLVRPSAPIEDGQYSAAEECVICLDKKPEVVFLPCGHVCCCFKCFASIALCPLCRKHIDEARDLIELS